MDHRAIYDRLMQRAVGRNLTGYIEAHHIQPRSLGGSNAKSNVVKLTYREHFLAHWLLVKFTTGDDRRRMGFALHRMGNKTKRALKWQAAIAKQANAEASRGAKCSEELKARNRAAMMGNKRQSARGVNLGNKGNKINHPKAHELSADTRAKLRAAAAKRHAMPMTEERRRKLHIAGRKRWQSADQLEML